MTQAESDTPQSPTFVRWGHATMAWNPNHHTLLVPAYFDDRAAVYVGEYVVGRLPNHIKLTIQAGRVIRDQSGTRAEEGWLTFESPQLFELDPRALRALVDDVVEAAVRAGEKDAAEDDARTDQFLAALRE